ncbi:hypothetical protein JM83_1135 [Gillisia sp. Hel_I_86]|uniref:hypothetical protein n=1 Tax=Gillisia sp. Hel_I_86 TaxID=1249981 RepID=UPI00119B3C95|nr:hypothetical protein [Gillisia sp. Hel_I_86]TVZ26182.1 hypothetical protein JM83_1135 [Gillisia sp. Hel_I_86]
MKTIKIISLSLLSVIGFTSCSSDDDNNDDDIPVVTTYSTSFGELNNSAVSGTATISIEDNKMTVEINASGLVADQAHPQHIHGKDANNEDATCPPASADTDGDGIITIPEGAPFYGGVLLPLDEFPTADATGNINYTKTFTLGEGDMPTLEALLPLENRAIVLHGLMQDDTYVATIPVACAQIVKD